jgi:putative transposase
MARRPAAGHDFGSWMSQFHMTGSATFGLVPRPPREQRPGYYHVTTRGNHGAIIYLASDDRHLFLALLNRTARDLSWSIHAWCLMTNHFHLIVEIPSENLSSGMHRVNGVYARWFNERHDRSGHLFERRFSAKRIEGDEQLQNTAEYILQNPVKAGLCSNPFDWPWLGGKLVAAARPARAA